MLDHFGESRAQLALGQRIERRDVGDHRARLVKGAEHVLALDMVDGGLAADRGVHLRKQRGRHLQQGHAALVDRGGKPGQIADHPAAERDDERIAAAARCQQRVEHALQARPALRLLAVVHNDLGHLRARCFKRF